MQRPKLRARTFPTLPGRSFFLISDIHRSTGAFGCKGCPVRLIWLDPNVLAGERNCPHVSPERFVRRSPPIRSCAAGVCGKHPATDRLDVSAIVCLSTRGIAGQGFSAAPLCHRQRTCCSRRYCGVVYTEYVIYIIQMSRQLRMSIGDVGFARSVAVLPEVQYIEAGGAQVKKVVQWFCEGVRTGERDIRRV